MAVHPTQLHRVYIQTLLNRRAMPDQVAIEMYKRAVGACSRADDTFEPDHPATREGFNEFISEITGLLEEFGMVVKRGREESRRGRWWTVLCNTESGEIAQHATDLTPLDITYFRIVIEAIIMSYPANSIGSRQALSLVSELETHMSKMDAQSLLNVLHSRNWLAKSSRGRYSLSTRAVLELDHYLKEEYADELQTCRRCSKLVISGYWCSTPDCGAHYHAYCYDAISRTARANCMSCKASFAEQQPNYLGERYVPRAEDEWVNRKRHRRSHANGNANGDNLDEDELEDGASMEEEEVERENSEPHRRHGRTSQSQSQSQSPVRNHTARRRRRAYDDDDESADEAGPTQHQTVVPDSMMDDDSEPVQRRRWR